MEIKGKVHCFFEQSGTFKNEFIKLGIPSEDYDIQNNFGQTDHVVDLFKNIEDAYDGKPSLFDDITQDDLIMSFFPCIHFCDAKTLFYRGVHISQRKWSIKKIMEFNIEESKHRQQFFEILMKLCYLVDELGLRLIIENPYNPSGNTYLECNFIKPSYIDKNRMMRGDYFIKPTAYWFISCKPTHGLTVQNDKKKKTIMSSKGSGSAGLCSEERSMISTDYARNFICDLIIGKEQINSELDLFK